MRFTAVVVGLILSAQMALAGAVGGTFKSIDGDTLVLENWRGGPVLVVNTASRCAFAGQYDALQAVYDRYRARGLVVLAVPSDDFRQELGTAKAVREFCALNFDLDLPMTDLTHVRGSSAHPFYGAVALETGFVPRWNFNKILLNGRGEVVGTWGARTRPDARTITGQIEALLD